MANTIWTDKDTIEVGEIISSQYMSNQLSEKQKLWLRGLFLTAGWVPMSASELGDPDISPLQTLGFVKIRHPTFAPKEWCITESGSNLISDLKNQGIPLSAAQ